jgi:hypothetical protein
MYDRGFGTLTKCRATVPEIRKGGFLRLLTPRPRTGSAENPITKMFPAAITEQRFLEALDTLCAKVSGLSYDDERESGHTLVDFRLRQGVAELPINVKNAGTRFESASALVGLDPNDCIPIPAYKAHNAIEAEPSLIYAVSVDYELVGKLKEVMPTLFERKEIIVWDLLTRHGGSRLRTGEDAFVFAATRRHWDRLHPHVQKNPYHAVSARRAIRVLQTKPKRTPGIGLRAWGTGASAEVNVHLSIAEETTKWEDVEGRVVGGGLQNIIEAVNRKKQEWVYDPEI